MKRIAYKFIRFITYDASIAKITLKGLADKVNKISSMLPEDATERYKNALMFL